MGLISIVVITITCFAFGDFKRGKAAVEEAVEVASNEIEHPNILFAIAPIVPVVLLVCASIWFPQLKMSVATAMLIGPFFLAVLTGSGDAAAFAFNEAVTPHAPTFGMTIDGLGYLAMMAAGIGRQASPLAGGIILLSGIAGVSPVEVVKRTAPAAVVMVLTLYFLV